MTQSSAEPIRRASPGFVIFSLAIGAFAIGTTEFAAMALIPYFSAELGVSETQATPAISAYALGVVVGAPLLAVLGAKLPQKLLLVLLMLAFAGFNVFSALAPTFDTLMVARFLCGLPHGAYFGVAAIVAANQVEPSHRSRAISRVFLGLTIATVLGVPAANVLGQTISWRVGFGVVGVLAVTTAVAVWMLVPLDRVQQGGSIRKQLTALRNRQVLLTLATGAIGFGGFFAVYSYIASTMVGDMQVDPATVPVALVVIGLGMTAGTVLSGWAADRNQTGAAFAFLFGALAVLLIYPSAAGHLWPYLAVLFLIGLSGGLPNILQARLLDVSGEGQQLASALNHSAFNAANALGPALASVAIASGLPFAASGYVGAALSAAGIVIFAITVWDARRNGTVSAPAP